MKLVYVVYDWLSTKLVGARTGVTIKMSKIDTSRKLITLNMVIVLIISIERSESTTRVA